MLVSKHKSNRAKACVFTLKKKRQWQTTSSTTTETGIPGIAQLKTQDEKVKAFFSLLMRSGDLSFRRCFFSLSFLFVVYFILYLDFSVSWVICACSYVCVCEGVRRTVFLSLHWLYHQIFRYMHIIYVRTVTATTMAEANSVCRSVLFGFKSSSSGIANAQIIIRINRNVTSAVGGVYINAERANLPSRLRARVARVT